MDRQIRVSAAYVDTVICDRVSLHESLRRNGLFCPKLKEAMMTADFMKGVIGYKRFWLPNISDIRLKNCITPPNKKELSELVGRQM